MSQPTSLNTDLPVRRSHVFWFWCLGGIVLLGSLCVGLGLVASRNQARQIHAALDRHGVFYRSERLVPSWAADPAIDHYMRGADPITRVRLTRYPEDDQAWTEIVSTLERLPRLQVLRFDRLPLTDDDLARFVHLSAIDSLNLTHTAITDEGLTTHLRSFPKLNWLNLDETNVTDEGLKTLAQLAPLEMISVERTSITDAGLLALQTLPNLDRIYVIETKVTDEGIAAFQQARPNVRVWR